MRSQQDIPRVGQSHTSKDEVRSAAARDYAASGADADDAVTLSNLDDQEVAALLDIFEQCANVSEDKADPRPEVAAKCRAIVAGCPESRMVTWGAASLRVEVARTIEEVFEGEVEFEFREGWAIVHGCHALIARLDALEGKRCDTSNDDGTVTLSALSEAEVAAVRAAFESYADAFEAMAVDVPDPPDVPETAEEAASDMRQAGELRAALVGIERSHTLTWNAAELRAMVWHLSEMPLRLVNGRATVMHRLDALGAAA